MNIRRNQRLSFGGVLLVTYLQQQTHKILLHKMPPHPLASRTVSCSLMSPRVNIGGVLTRT